MWTAAFCTNVGRQKLHSGIHRCAAQSKLPGIPVSAGKRSFCKPAIKYGTGAFFSTGCCVTNFTDATQPNEHRYTNCTSKQSFRSPQLTIPVAGISPLAKVMPFVKSVAYLTEVGD